MLRDNEVPEAVKDSGLLKFNRRVYRFGSVMEMVEKGEQGAGTIEKWKGGIQKIVGCQT